MVVVEAVKSFASVGRATLVIVMSSRSMKTPNTKTWPTSHLYSRRSLTPRTPPPVASEGGDLRDDVPAHHFDRLQTLDADQDAYSFLRARLGEPAELLHHLSRHLPTRTRVHDEVDGLLNLVVAAALGLAVCPQHLKLASGGIDIAEDVAGIALARAQAQGLALPAAPDEDRGPRLPQRLRRVQRLRQPVVLPLEGAVVVAPHLQDDLERLLQPLEPLLEGRERHPPSHMLPLPPP